MVDLISLVLSFVRSLELVGRPVDLFAGLSLFACFGCFGLRFVALGFGAALGFELLFLTVELLKRLGGCCWLWPRSDWQVVEPAGVARERRTG